MAKIANLILDSPLLPVIGVVASAIGIAAYFLPWSSMGGYTGLDLLMGDTGLSGFQAYLPTVATLLMVFILIVSAMGVVDRRRRMTFYGMIIFGFLTLLIIVLFGNWTPLEDYKLLTNGGLGFYVAMFSAILYFLAGVVGYSVRPLPPPPERVTAQNKNRK